jgi:hypothetical protein
MIIHAKQQFFLNSNDFLDKNSSDPKLFWSLVKKLMGNVGRSCTMPPLLDTENDILYVDDIDKCNLLNSFFCSISNLDDINCMDNHVINFIPLNLIFAYVINIRLFAHFFMKRIANFHFSFNTRIKPRFITVAYCNCFCWDTLSGKL